MNALMFFVTRFLDREACEIPNQVVVSSKSSVQVDQFKRPRDRQRVLT